MKGENMTIVVSIRIEEEEAEEIDALAVKGRVTRSEVLRLAIKDHLKEASERLVSNPFLYRD